jgi:UDPglucose 6-dehydrogenase
MRVAVIGTGYVGVVAAACLAAAGHRVTCTDSDAARLSALAAGICPIHEPGLADLVWVETASGHLRVAPDIASACDGAAVSLICVGTPTVNGTADLTALKTVAEAIGAAIAGRGDFPVVAVKSTVPPGTTDTLVRTIIEHGAGMTEGEGFGLAMIPEFLSQGSAVADFLSPSRVIIGAGQARSAALLRELWRHTDAPILVMSPREAEMAKLAANALQDQLCQPNRRSVRSVSRLRPSPGNGFRPS